MSGTLDKAYEEYAAKCAWSGEEENELLDEQPGSLNLDKDANRILRLPNRDMQVRNQIELHCLLSKIKSKPQAFVEVIQSKRQGKSVDFYVKKRNSPTTREEEEEEEETGGCSKRIGFVCPSPPKSPLPAVDPDKLFQYQVKSIIGKGNFSVVYCAKRQPNNNNENQEELVALKRVELDSLQTDTARKKCYKEVAALKYLRHPHLILCLDMFRTSKGLFLVLEFAAAGDLRHLLHRVKSQRSRFHEKIVWGYFIQIAEAVAYMHSERVMHRDIKPANVFVMPNGVLKLGDLGLSRAFSTESMQAYSKVGTPLYMSPQVLQGAGHDFKSDVWATGCVLFELAMLFHPFGAGCKNMHELFMRIIQGRFSAVSSNYSQHLVHVVEMLLSVDSCTRPCAATMVELAKETACL